MTESRAAYVEAGVDVDEGDRAVELLRRSIPRAHGDLLGIGAFGAALEIPTGYRNPLLVTSTDGVGTKTEIARRLGRYDTIGQDLVAMCVDDIVCHGARPAYFLDYIAVGKLNGERVAEIVGGIASACDAVGCALVGGETAEHPGLMEEDEFDLAGFCIGFVERDALVDGSAARPGDIVVGFQSSGLHANGYSLVRRLIDEGKLDLTDDLVTPTRLYAPTVLALRDWLRDRGHDYHGLAHITGGGLRANLPRAVGPELGILLYPEDWPGEDIADRIWAATGMSPAENRAIFNNGIGFAIVLDREAVNAELFRWLYRKNDLVAWSIGEVVPTTELRGERYMERAI